MKITIYHLVIFFLTVTIVSVPAFGYTHLTAEALYTPIEGFIELFIGIAMIVGYKMIRHKEQLLKP